MAEVRINQNFEGQMLKTARTMLQKVAHELVNECKRTLSRGRRGSVGDLHTAIGAGEPPHVDTGRLRNSIFWDWKDANTIRVGTPLTYGLWLEIGVFVRPKTHKMLAIPLSKEARQWSERGNGARSFGLAYDTTIIVTKRGTMLIVEKKRNKFIIHYLLTYSATIPPHPWLRPSLEAMRPRIQKIFSGGAA